jgi:hypothetical protein
MNPDKVLSITAEHFGTNVSELKSVRGKGKGMPRKVACVMLCTFTTLSLKEVSIAAFDPPAYHQSVHASKQKVGDKVDSNPAFAKSVNDLAKKLYDCSRAIDIKHNYRVTDLKENSNLRDGFDRVVFTGSYAECSAKRQELLAQV